MNYLQGFSIPKLAKASHFTIRNFSLILSNDVISPERGRRATKMSPVNTGGVPTESSI